MAEMRAGERVRYFRRQRRWSLRELERRCGLTKNRLHHIETRPESEPRASEMRSLADAFSTSVEHLFFDTLANDGHAPVSDIRPLPTTRSSPVL